MDLTTRRFVFPAFRQPQLNKNQSLVGLKAGFFSPSSSLTRPVSGREQDEFVYNDEGRWIRVLFVNKEPLVHRLTSSFYHTIIS